MSTISRAPSSLPSITSTQATGDVSPAAASTPAPAAERTGGWGPSNAPRPAVTAPATQPASVAAVARTPAPPAPMAPAARDFVEAFAVDSDPVSCSLATNAAADGLVKASFAVIQRELADRGETAAAIDLSKKISAIPSAATDRAEPMETVEANGERLAQLMGLLGKFSAAIGRGEQTPAPTAQGYGQKASADLTRAEVNFAGAFRDAYGVSGADPQVIADARQFLDGLGAQAEAMIAGHDVPQALIPAARDEVAAQLLEAYSAKLAQTQAPIPPPGE